MASGGGAVRAGLTEEVTFEQGSGERTRSPAEKSKDGGSSECTGAEEPSQWEGEEEEHGRGREKMRMQRWMGPDPRGIST